MLSIHAFAEPRYIVTAKSLNVRTGPGTNYQVYDKLHRGDTVVVYGHEGQWATVTDGKRWCYVNTQYLRYLDEIEIPQQQSESADVNIWDRLYEIVKVILWILFALFVIGCFVENDLSAFASLMLVVCGIGAIIGWLCFDNAHAGAVVTMGIELVLVVYFIIRHVVSDFDFEFPVFSGISYLIWYLVSLPFYLLNMLQFWLAKPWRPLMKRNVFSDTTKPAMRTFLRILQVPFYLALFPLRLVNAIYYNIIIYNLYAWSNYIVEVFVPSDSEEGAGSVTGWLFYMPKRIFKYLLWHGVLTTIESVVWTVIDTFVPAVTLFHGTELECADNMLCDPSRNQYRKSATGWLTGIWNVGGGNYAGDGIYFGLFRKTLRNYARGSAIVARVTMGKTIDTILMPNDVYRTAGFPDAKAVSNWGLNNGYVCGEWWRSDRNTNWWEICMYDRQNRYNESWRIRPIYAIHSYSGIMQRIPGGPAHWFFRKQAVKDISYTIKNKFK